MSTVMDHTITDGVESTWGTAVTPTRATEILADSEIEWDQQPEQGEGLRVSTLADLYERRRAGLGMGTLTEKSNPLTKGFGRKLQACFGTGVSNVVSGAIYQQLFTVVQTGLYLPFRTLQAGIVDSTGTVSPMTFPGAQVKSWELDIPGNGKMELTVEWDLRSIDTATSLTAVSGLFPTQGTSPVSPSLFMGRDAGASGITLGGSLTVPTTTALGSGGTAVTNWRSINVKCDNGLAEDEEAARLGAWVQPIAGKRKIQISGTVTFASATERTAFLAQTAVAFSAKFITPELVSGSTYATLQIAAPNCMINSGAVASPTTDGPTTMDIELEALSSVANPIPLYGAIVTGDTAL